MVLAKNTHLSEPQFTLLNRGLTFIPTTDIYKSQKTQIQLDIQNYNRKIKITTYYKSTNKKDPLPFIGPSMWIPSDKLPPEVNQLIEADREDIKRLYKPCKEKPHLSKLEVKALTELMNNKHIVIQPADKGSAVVVLGRDQYITEVNRQLNNKTYYKKLTDPIYLQTVPRVQDILDRLQKDKFITAKQKTSTRTLTHGQYLLKYPLVGLSFQIVIAKPTKRQSLMIIFRTLFLSNILFILKIPTNLLTQLEACSYL